MPNEDGNANFEGTTGRRLLYNNTHLKLPYIDMTIMPTFKNNMTNCKLSELPAEVFEITFMNCEDVSASKEVYPDHPLADSEIYDDSIILTSKKLTCGENVKEVFLIELPSHASGRKYEPGDTIGILPQNPNADLFKLFDHLKISHLIHENCRVIKQNPDIKLKSKPVFLDQVTTLYDIFRNFIDIRCIPKKTLIRLMVEYTMDGNEKKILEELCSNDGAKKYEEEILANNKTFIDILTSFSSCCPPAVRLIENLPLLLPRSYSIASSPLSSPNSLKIVFTVAHSILNGVSKEGLCTGMLKSIIQMGEDNKHESAAVKMFYRKPGRFRLPKEDKHPLILIGPGGGVAPFMGFLEHRKMLQSKGTIWLFYGCRYKWNDYLFKNELEDFLNCGVLSELFVSFSREPGDHSKYVQDNLKNYGKEICDMIYDKNALIYVCGDAKGLRKDVMNTLISIVQEYKGLTLKEANDFIKDLQKKERYLQDVWL